VTRRIRSPGRARNKPLKPLRAGMPGDLGWTCGDYARVLHFIICTRGCGCGGHPAFPTPSLGETVQHHSGASRREIADAHLNQSGAALVQSAPVSEPSSSAWHPGVRQAVPANVRCLSGRHFNGWFALLCQFWRVRWCDRPPSIGPEIKREHLVKEAADFCSCGDACLRRRRRLRG
jgi:hypothetical protein